MRLCMYLIIYYRDSLQRFALQDFDHVNFSNEAGVYNLNWRKLLNVGESLLCIFAPVHIRAKLYAAFFTSLINVEI